MTIKTFPLGDFALQGGGVLRGAWLAYETFGDPSLPTVLYPTWYSGTIADNHWLIGKGRTLSPDDYFIVVPALFGNGQSTSPSNYPGSDTDSSASSPFPDVSIYDNVRAQHELVTRGLGVGRLRAILGWSMGAAQSYQWAVQYPDMVDLCVPFCGAARTSLHNQVFLEGVKSALLAAKGATSAGSCQGRVEAGQDKLPSARTWSAAEREVGLKAFGRVYAGWGFSQTFYRQQLYRTHYGAADLETFMREFWETWALSKDPENLLVMLQTWQSADVSQQEPYGGDFEKAMAAIRARTLVLPSKTDLYFPPEDSEYEVACMRPGVAELDVYPSVWGHWAGGPPGNMEDVEWLDARLRRVFGEVASR